MVNLIAYRCPSVNIRVNFEKVHVICAKPISNSMICSLLFSAISLASTNQIAEHFHALCSHARHCIRLYANVLSIKASRVSFASVTLIA